MKNPEKTLADDKLQYVKEVQVKAAKAFARNDQQELHACVRRLSPYKPRAPRAVLQEDGTLARTAVEIAQRWQAYFADKMSGTMTTMADLAKVARERQARRWSDGTMASILLRIDSTVAAD